MAGSRSPCGVDDGSRWVGMTGLAGLVRLDSGDMASKLRRSVAAG